MYRQEVPDSFETTLRSIPVSLPPPPVVGRKNSRKFSKVSCLLSPNPIQFYDTKQPRFFST